MIPELNPYNIFQSVGTDTPIIVAVSGGSDSLALLHLASAWSKQEDIDLRVVTVDHGLRPEAAAEAAFVAGVCEGLGLPHYTLAWEGKKPTSGVSEAARDARYLLMSEFAEDIGAREILTGHTANDQAETIWMRNSRDGGNPQLRGLAGMANSIILPSGISVLRPLLKYERNLLRDYLKTIGQAWIEDPSNEDISYERVRARMAIAQSGIDVGLVCRFAELIGRQRKVVSDVVSQLLIEHLDVAKGPVFSIPYSIVAGPDENISVLLAQVLIAIAGGREHLISHEIAQQVLELPEGKRLNAGYAIVERHKNFLRLYREKRNLGIVVIPPGGNATWDNRLRIDNQTPHSYTCSSASPSLLNAIEEENGKRLEVFPRAALQSSPVMVCEDGSVLMPFVTDFESDEGLALKYTIPALENYCSEYDLSLLKAVRYVQQKVVQEKLSRKI